MNLGGISKAMFGSGIVCRLSYEKVENANKMYGDTGVYGMLLYCSLFSSASFPGFPLYYEAF